MPNGERMPSLTIPPAIRRGITAGQQYICTQAVCLGVWSTAWCAICQAPRCAKHSKDGACATCGSPTVSFTAITATERENEDRYELPGRLAIR